MLIKVRFLPSPRDWVLLFLMITFQSDGFQVLEKNIPDLYKTYHKRTDKGFTIASF